MSAGYTGPACQDQEHHKCPGFWAAKFGASGRGTACACSCHGNDNRCLWPACSRPLPCPIHDRAPGAVGQGAPAFEPLPADYRYQGGGQRPSAGPRPQPSSFVDSRPASMTLPDGYGPPAGPEDDDFPIEDYDSLGVKEIVSLLDQLDLYDLDAVRDWEAQGRRRAGILRPVERRIAELEAAEVAGGQPVEGDDGAALLDDYDHLPVFEIMGMLKDLDDDELMAVAELEEEGRGRSGILSRIETLMTERGLLGGEEEAGPAEIRPGQRWVAEPDDDRPGALDADEDTVEGGPAEAGDDAAGDDAVPFGDDLGATGQVDLDDEPADADGPIEDYDRLRVKDIVVRLAELELDELEAVRLREAQGKGRTTVLRAIDANIAEFELVEVEEPADELVEEDEGGPMAAGGIDLDAQDLDAEDLDAEDSEPIENYDRLSVLQILRLLPDLDAGRLKAVADFEEEGRNRPAVLDRIDALLEER